jgi:hypothetical protein
MMCKHMAAFIGCLLIYTSASAGETSSASYAIKWDVTDSGGGGSTSTSYVVEG